MNNKIYLIMGASSDIGIAYIKSLEKQLLRDGQTAQVIAHYRAGDTALKMLQNSLKAICLKLVQADLTQFDEVEQMLLCIKEEYGCPDHILHLPASKLVYQKLKKLEWDAVLRDMEIQVHSLAEACRTFLPLMAKQGYGKVVVMLSSATLGMPPKFMSQYVIVKYALLGLMKSMAMEYAEKGININGISPNMVETKFLEQIDDRIIEINRDNCTLKRNVEIEEVLPAIHFLMSEGSDYMNGVNLNLTGGDR